MNTLSIPATEFNQLEAFEANASKLPPAEVKVVNTFCDGMWAKEMSCGAGVALSSKIHKKATISILSQGSMIITAEGQPPQFIEAPMMILSTPGVKRVALTCSPVVWTTFVRTELTDPDAAEAEVTCISLEDFRKHQATLTVKEF